MRQRRLVDSDGMECPADECFPADWLEVRPVVIQVPHTHARRPAHRGARLVAGPVPYIRKDNAMLHKMDIELCATARS
ncbi:hypothetical protein GCM10009578_038630 [Streptomyces rhizosphaericus]